MREDEELPSMCIFKSKTNKWTVKPLSQRQGRAVLSLTTRIVHPLTAPLPLTPSLLFVFHVPLILAQMLIWIDSTSLRLEELGKVHSINGPRPYSILRWLCLPQLVEGLFSLVESSIPWRNWLAEILGKFKSPSLIESNSRGSLGT